MASSAYFHREAISRGAIYGDYDNDGDYDVVVMNLNGPTELLRNDGGNRQGWIRLKLIGTQSNRDGIGARVTVTVGGPINYEGGTSGVQLYVQ